MSKMYLTASEHKTMGLPPMAEQIERYNNARQGKAWIVRFGNSVFMFHTEYHAEQFARALTLNQTLYTMERPS